MEFGGKGKYHADRIGFVVHNRELSHNLRGLNRIDQVQRGQQHV